MDDNNKLKSRRDFLTFTNSTEEKGSTLNDSNDLNKDKIKMLTADGKLVEVDRSVVINSTDRKKASKKDIHEWVTINPNQS